MVDQVCKVRHYTDIQYSAGYVEIKGGTLNTFKSSFALLALLVMGCSSITPRADVVLTIEDVATQQDPCGGVECEDGNPCTVNSCNAGTGECELRLVSECKNVCSWDMHNRVAAVHCITAGDELGLCYGDLCMVQGNSCAEVENTQAACDLDDPCMNHSCESGWCAYHRYAGVGKYVDGTYALCTDEFSALTFACVTDADCNSGNPHLAGEKGICFPTKDRVRATFRCIGGFCSTGYFSCPGCKQGGEGGLGSYVCAYPNATCVATVPYTITSADGALLGSGDLSADLQCCNTDADCTGTAKYCVQTDIPQQYGQEGWLGMCNGCDPNNASTCPEGLVCTQEVEVLSRDIDVAITNLYALSGGTTLGMPTRMMHYCR